MKKSKAFKIVFTVCAGIFLVLSAAALKPAPILAEQDCYTFERGLESKISLCF